MKKLLLFLGTLVIVSAAYLKFQHCPHVFRRFSAAILFQKYVPASDIQFHRNRMAADGPGPRGSRLGASSVISSDCITITWGIYRFSDPHDADEQFREWVRSWRVIQVEDSSSRERALLEDPAKRTFYIISKEKNGADILSIWSDSLEHALLYEKQQNAERISRK